ncbi:unnamed protein product [Ectocarpus sp. 8 AP-2014]
MKTGWIRLLLLLGRLSLATTAAVEGGSPSAAPSPSSSSPSPDTESPPLPVGIVIQALGRSGSTLIGELFRENEDVVYVYEPCRASGKGVLGNYQMLLRAECFALARRLVRCEFDVNDSDRLGTDGFAAGFSSPVVADVHKSVKAGKGSGGGYRAELLHRAHQALMDACKESRAVAIKTIRLLDGVGDAEKYDTSGVNILQLVRDPRAVVRSQLRHWGLDRFSEALPNVRELKGMTDWRARQTESRRAVGQYICSNYRMQLDSPKQQHLDDGKYLQLRYEDFATLPTVVAELVYCWAGLGPLPPTVATWIDEHTKMPNCDAAHGPRTRRRMATSLVATAASHEDCGGSMAVLVSGCEQEEQHHREIGHTDALRKPGNLRKRSRPGKASFLVPVGESAGPIPASHRQSNSSREAARGTESSDLQGYATSVSASGTTVVSTGTTNGSPPVRPNSRKALEGAAGTAGADKGTGGDCVNQKRYSDQHPYDTKRHSSAMIDLWRQQMPQADAQAVWDACQESRVMEELGYSL